MHVQLCSQQTPLQATMKIVPCPFDAHMPHPSRPCARMQRKDIRCARVWSICMCTIPQWAGHFRCFLKANVFSLIVASLLTISENGPTNAQRPTPNLGWSSLRLQGIGQLQTTCFFFHCPQRLHAFPQCAQGTSTVACLARTWPTCRSAGAPSALEAQCADVWHAQ